MNESQANTIIELLKEIRNEIHNLGPKLDTIQQAEAAQIPVTQPQV